MEQIGKVLDQTMGRTLDRREQRGRGPESAASTPPRAQTNEPEPLPDQYKIHPNEAKAKGYTYNSEPPASEPCPYCGRMLYHYGAIMPGQKHVFTWFEETEHLSARFQWVERCEAYDLYILRRLKEKGEAEILKMHENHAAIAAQMLKKAMRRLLTMQEEEIAASDMVRMVDVGVKIERLSRGESTERQEIGGETTVRHSGEVSVKPGNGLDLSGLSDEELGNLEQLLSKLHPE